MSEPKEKQKQKQSAKTATLEVVKAEAPPKIAGKEQVGSAPEKPESEIDAESTVTIVGGVNVEENYIQNEQRIATPENLSSMFATTDKIKISAYRMAKAARARRRNSPAFIIATAVLSTALAFFTIWTITALSLSAFANIQMAGLENERGSGLFVGKLDKEKNIIIGTYYISVFSSLKIDTELKTIEYSNGDSYSGDISGVLRDGYGTLILNNGDKYQGNFKLDLFEGVGEYTYSTGDVYTGEFAAGKRSGNGVYTWLAGGSFEGEFEDGKMKFGKLTYISGDVYEGEFENGAPHGIGKYIYTDGDIYEGEFKRGLFSGEGKYVYAGGNLYEGEFTAGKCEGYGKLTYAGGDVYEGGFANGVFEGQGTYTWKNGQTQTGTYKDGKLQN